MFKFFNISTLTVFLGFSFVQSDRIMTELGLFWLNPRFHSHSLHHSFVNYNLKLVSQNWIYNLVKITNITQASVILRTSITTKQFTGNTKKLLRIIIFNLHKTFKLQKSNKE